MPGDLNLKKSWHPGLGRNQAKVKEREQQALDDRRKIAERQKEIEREREAAELKAMQGQTSSRLSWMYADAKQDNTSSDKEAYLLGKKRIEPQMFEPTKKQGEKRVDQQKNMDDPMAAFLDARPTKPAKGSAPKPKSKSKSKKITSEKPVPAGRSVKRY